MYICKNYISNFSVYRWYYWWNIGGISSVKQTYRRQLWVPRKLSKKVPIFVFFCRFLCVFLHLQAITQVHRISQRYNADLITYTVFILSVEIKTIIFKRVFQQRCVIKCMWIPCFYDASYNPRACLIYNSKDNII